MAADSQSLKPLARIRVTGRDIEISLPGRLCSRDLNRLVHRAFAYVHTDSVHLDPLICKLQIRLSSGNVDTKESLASLADLMVRKTIPNKSLPDIPITEAFTFRRWRGVVTALNIQNQTLGQVSVMVPRDISERIIRESLQSFRGLPGVYQVITARYSRRIIISYDPKADQTIWVRALERILYPPARFPELIEVPTIQSLAPNINLMLCSAGQFLYPPAIPMVSAVLILSRIPQFSRATKELCRGKIGASFYRSVIVICSVAAAAPFASALAEWLTCYWERRITKLLVRESQDLIATLPQATAIPASGVRRKFIPLTTGDLVTFDGLVSKGELLVRDGLLIDSRSAPLIRKKKGDPLFSGYQIIGGQGVLKPFDDVDEGRLNSVIQVVAKLPIRLTEDETLNGEARRLGDLSVYPNLALAGVAYSMGGLPMVGAVMNQDWMASPRIAARTEFFRDLRIGLEYGAMIRTPEALKCLAETRVLLIEADYPGLLDLRPCVTSIESDGKPVSRANSWAHILANWVGDGRAEALRDLGRASDIDNVESSLVSYEGGRTELRIEGHRVVLENLKEGGDWPSLRINIDGEPSETLRFGSTEISLLARTFERLRALGIATVVYGSGASHVGQITGVDAIYPDIDDSVLAKLRTILKDKGYSSSLISSRSPDASLIDDSPVVIGPLVHIKGLNAPTIELLGDSLDGLPELVLVARTLKLRIGQASARTIPTNLLCILGAFSGIFNGAMSVVIAHSGVFGVSHTQSQRIKQPKRKAS